MKRLILIVLAMLAVGTVATAQPSPPPPASEKPAAVKKPTVRNVSGTVKSSSSDTVVVAGRDKGKDAEWTFGVDLTTDIRKGTKSITAGDLKAGESVNVRFVEQDGKAMARSILVRGKAASPAKKAKP